MRQLTYIQCGIDMANGSRHRAQGEKRQFDFPYPCAVSLAPCAFAQMNPILIQSPMRLNPEIYDTRYLLYISNRSINLLNDLLLRKCRINLAQKLFISKML